MGGNEEKKWGEMKKRNGRKREKINWEGKKKKKVDESPWRDLNSRPLVYKTSALTTELQRQHSFKNGA